MSYIGNRLAHDADSHIMERSDCLDAYLESRLLTRFRDLPLSKLPGNMTGAWTPPRKRKRGGLSRSSR